MFKCLSWNPVTWSFEGEGGPLLSNSYAGESPNSQTLLIHNIQLKNGGTYTCRGKAGKLGDLNSFLFEDEGVLVVLGISFDY